MTVPSCEKWIMVGLLLLAAGVFGTGIGWGLPSRRTDPFLFGDRRPWTGEQIQVLTRAAGEQWDDPSRGADVAAGPRATTGDRRERGGPTGRPEVNATDADRAQIVRRYRLFTYQPDEMITLMSLARMHPGRGDLDPRLYQYGGLWIYPVGALLKVASVLHVVQLRSGPDGLAYYLDHPEAFGRFYVVARLYAAAWGLVGVWAVYQIVRRLTGKAAAAAGAAALFILMPVTVNMAHEAKPHLPGAALVLLAVLAGSGYVRTGRRRDALAAGGLCGAAFGMVLSMLPVFAILPLMTLLRPMNWRRRLGITLAAAGAGAAVYAATNPYVLLHQFWHREVFESNVGNSTAVYQVGRPIEGVVNAASLAAEGMTAPLAVAGAIGAIALGWRARARKDRSEAEVSRRSIGLLLAAPALLIAVQFAVIGAGKPGEFGRFLLVPDIFLLVEAVVALSTFVRFTTERRGEQGVKSWGMPLVRAGVMAALLGSTAWGGYVYLRGFVADSQPVTSRLREAGLLRMLVRSGEAQKLAVAADPAPYCLPPVDLFRWKIIKLPDLAPAGGVVTVGHEDGGGTEGRGEAGVDDAGVDVVVLPVDRMAEESRLLTARISWAAKPIEIRIAGARQGLGAVPPSAEP